VQCASDGDRLCAVRVDRACPRDATRCVAHRDDGDGTAGRARGQTRSRHDWRLLPVGRACAPLHLRVCGPGRAHTVAPSREKAAARLGAGKHDATSRAELQSSGVFFGGLRPLHGFRAI